MKSIEILKQAVKEKSAKKFNEKMDEFRHAIVYDKESREAHKIIIAKIAKGLGMGDNLRKGGIREIKSNNTLS